MQTQQAGLKPRRGLEDHEGNSRTSTDRPPFTSLIDAKGASLMLGVPHTLLLAQARAGRIPHHRLGHYVRFDPDDLKRWLSQTRIEPHAPLRRRS
jgi:excisionase family DNA binding protein